MNDDTLRFNDMAVAPFTLTICVISGFHTQTGRREKKCMQDSGMKEFRGFFCVLSLCSRAGKSLYVLPPGLRFLPTMPYRSLYKYPKGRRKGAIEDVEEEEEEGGLHVVPQSGAMAQQAWRCPLDAGWVFFFFFLMWRTREWARFLMLCNFEDGVFEVMHELDSFSASSWFVFVFFSPSLSSLRAFFFSMRGTSYVFEVKECFKGICRSAPLWCSGLRRVHPLIVSLK